MIQRQRFDPDIQIKYHQIIAHMGDKNKVVQQFAKILKELCDWQMFNSKNLDKFANSISKLLAGKDPLKDAFILFQRILASKSEQANKVAVSIKQDMLPFLQKAINLKDQNSIKAQQNKIKQLKFNMNNKIRQLFSAEINYKNMCEKSKALNHSSMIQSRQRIQQITRLKRDLLDSQAYLTEVINIYNHSVQDYMLNYTKLCQQLSQIQTNRKITIKQSISKYIVFQMDAIKNIEYDLSRYAKSIQKMQDKLVIQDKINHNPDLKIFQLAKISPNNYIMHLTQRQVKNQTQSSFQTQSQRRLNQIKRFLDPQNQNYEIKKQSFNNLLMDINQLLTESIDIYDIKTLKQIVYYSKNYYMLSSLPNLNKRKNISTDSKVQKQQNQNQQLIFRRTKISLLNAILCHPIFKNQQFWQKYNNRLADIVQRQINSTSVMRRSDQLKLSLSFLASDLDFMKNISSAPLVDKILSKYEKYGLGSSQNIIKSSDSIKSKTDSTQSKQKSKKGQKDVNKMDSQKVQRKIGDQSDHIYF